ncbi:hypothetical protein DH2020_016868 [Rehmannia glutinosa]|uniref:Tf2-1-like SH3-like domain-containing protein n=1 Tax=Rehmannia glutinosa TaxID=99300 RepID=A0ABR0WR15_REHGL
MLDFGGGWERYLQLIEFSYNNSYQSTIGMAPYEALYGRKCRSPIHWDEVGEKKVLGPDIVKRTIEAIERIRERIKVAQDRHKSYADPKRKELQFVVGEKVFLRVSPIGKLAYRLELAAPYAGMHDVFHVSRLKKYQPDPEHIITRDTPPLMENLSYTERPIRIIDQQIRRLRKREIPMVKMVWQNHNRDEDATWEMEEDIRNQYSELF